MIFHIFQTPRQPTSQQSKTLSSLQVAKTDDELELIKASVRATQNRVENATKDLQNRLETRNKVKELKEKLMSKKRKASENENSSDGAENDKDSLQAKEVFQKEKGSDQTANSGHNDSISNDMPVQEPIALK